MASEPPPAIEIVQIGRAGRCAGCGANHGLAAFFRPGGALLCLGCLAQARLVGIAWFVEGGREMDREVERTAGLEPAPSGLGSRRSTSRAASAWECDACRDTGTILVYGSAEPCASCEIGRRK